VNRPPSPCAASVAGDESRIVVRATLAFNFAVAIKIFRIQKCGAAGRMFWLLSLFCFLSQNARAARDICDVCTKEIRLSVYTWGDKVTRTKRLLCLDCTKLPDSCYLCSVPVALDFKTLPDGRVLCKRDFSTVVLDENAATEICERVRENLDRQFVRFIRFAQTNVQIGLMDRVTLQEMFRIIGNDFSCPNTLGCTKTITNNGGRAFEISILSGQPREDLITTCVHELAHTWVIENTPRSRMKTIGKDAVEGFCELLSYRYAEANGLASGLTNILANHYTRGQIHLFIKADKQFGFDQVVDWMKWGEDPVLSSNDLGRLRRLDMSTPVKRGVSKTNAAVVSSYTNAPPPTTPTRLKLQGIIWSETRPMATINGKNLEPGEEATFELGNGTNLVRCLAIRRNSVVIQTNHSTENLVLELQ
jgi:hypothetical protein